MFLQRTRSLGNGQCHIKWNGQRPIGHTTFKQFVHLLIGLLVSFQAKSEIFISKIQNATNNSSCNGKISLVATGTAGPFDITWSTGSTLDISGEYEIPTGFCVGHHTIRVIDATGCEKILNAEIRNCAVVQGGLFVDADVTPLSSAGASDGEIMLAVNSVENVTVSWTGPGGFVSDQYSLVGLSAGTYTVEVSDGCEFSQIHYNVKTCDEIEIFSNQVMPCRYAADGRLTIFFENGYSALLSSWENGQEGLTASGLMAGEHSVHISFGGCVTERIINLEELSDGPEFTTAHQFCQDVRYCKGTPVDTSQRSFETLFGWYADQTCVAFRGCSNGTALAEPRAPISDYYFEFNNTGERDPITGQLYSPCWAFVTCPYMPAGSYARINGRIKSICLTVKNCICAFDNLGLSFPIEPFRCSCGDCCADAQTSLVMSQLDDTVKGDNYSIAEVDDNLEDENILSSLTKDSNFSKSALSLRQEPQVYPNPFTSSISLVLDDSLKLEMGRSVYLRMVNSLGQAVWNTQINGMPNGMESIMIPGDIPDGPYTLELFDVNGNLKVAKRLIRMR